jgi:hypothetical protein
MKTDIEFILRHDGELWVCHNDTLTASGESIFLLDQDIQRVVRESKKYPCGTRLHVFMGFDFDTIPTWLRQYHNHYFNRTVKINI